MAVAKKQRYQENNMPSFIPNSTNNASSKQRFVTKVVVDEYLPLTDV